MTEPRFIAHCDDPPCDLGCVEYDCPACGRSSTNYEDLWWERDKVHCGDQLVFVCEKCGVKLVMLNDKDGFPDIVLAS